MKRTLSAAVAAAFLLATPLAAMHNKGTKNRCRTEYNAAKKEARKAATHKERVAGVKAAKRNYETCLKREKS